jgi:hypothetical protein
MNPLLRFSQDPVGTMTHGAGDVNPSEAGRDALLVRTASCHGGSTAALKIRAVHDVLKELSIVLASVAN